MSAVGSNPKEKKVAGQVKALRRYLAAQAAFERAIQGLRYLQGPSIAADSWNYSTMFCGICITYAAPFMSSNGLGPLPNEMEYFKAGTEFENIHNTMVRARNSLFAHHSPDEISGLVQGDLPADDLGVRIKASGRPLHYMVQYRNPLWVKERLETIVELCVYQTYRVKNLAISIFKEFEKEHGGPYAPGIYELGKDFPGPTPVIPAMPDLEKPS